MLVSIPTYTDSTWQTQRNVPHCHVPETIQHFFFDCPEYEAPRLNMIRELQSLADAPLTIKTLLGGCNLPHRTNFKIASKVACYIKATNRIQDLWSPSSDWINTRTSSVDRNQVGAPLLWSSLALELKIQQITRRILKIAISLLKN